MHCCRFPLARERRTSTFVESYQGFFVVSTGFGSCTVVNSLPRAGVKDEDARKIIIIQQKRALLLNLIRDFGPLEALLSILIRDFRRFDRGLVHALL